MKLKWFMLFPALLALKGYSDEAQSIEERIEFLEQKRGYQFKKRDFRGVAEAELLYWKADVDGVAYATTFVAEPALDAGGEAATHIRTRTPHFSYDPGFRVGLGFESPFDLYDVLFVWTRFTTQGSDHTHKVASSIPVPGEKLIFGEIGLIDTPFTFPNAASAKCNIKENLIDLQLGRGIDVSPHFFMRPYFGLKAVWSAIDWNIKMKQNFVIPAGFDQDSTVLKVNNNFHGVGGLVGVNLNWKAPMGFGVNVRGAGALVWGLAEERTRQKSLFVPAGTATTFKENFKAGNSFHSLKSLWELFVGVFWEIHFPNPPEHPDLRDLIDEKKQKRRTSLRLFAGYEIQQWPYFGQKTNVQVTRERDRFSVGFQGFTGGARVVF